MIYEPHPMATVRVAEQQHFYAVPARDPGKQEFEAAPMASTPSLIHTGTIPNDFK
jgi:hypothetical protein